MTPNLEFVSEQDSATDGARKMRDVNIGALPVVNSADQISGIVTDRDIVVRGIAEGKNPAQTKVQDLMTAGVVTCSADMSVEEAAELMERGKIRRLVVTDDNKAVGMLALGDLAAKSQSQEMTGKTVEGISKPSEPKRMD